jgi:fluoride exporter
VSAVRTGFGFQAKDKIMLKLMLVFAGGGIGSLLRYGTGLLMLRLFGAGFPVGTVAVNLIGCTIMGIFARTLPAPDDGGADMRLLLMTGVLGGFTTFSAFALDAAGLWMREEPLATLGYVSLSVFGSLAGVALGLLISKTFMP